VELGFKRRTARSGRSTSTPWRRRSTATSSTTWRRSRSRGSRRRRRRSLVGKKGELAAGFAQLQADGTTSCGNWLYCQSYNEKGNMMARRVRKDATGLGLFPEWAWRGR